MYIHPRELVIRQLYPISSVFNIIFKISAYFKFHLVLFMLILV
jgi:hypothetical protein